MKPKGSFTRRCKPLIDRAFRLYGEGLSLEEVGDRVGRSRQTLWTAFHRRGVKMRPHERHGLDNHFYRDGQSRTPEKLRARKRVNKARKSGRLQPQPCEKCGAPASLSEAHHTDYAKPLDVHWLCAECHRAEHGAAA